MHGADDLAVAAVPSELTGRVEGRDIHGGRQLCIVQVGLGQGGALRGGILLDRTLARPIARLNLVRGDDLGIVLLSAR